MKICVAHDDGLGGYGAIGNRCRQTQQMLSCTRDLVYALLLMVMPYLVVWSGDWLSPAHSGPGQLLLELLLASGKPYRLEGTFARQIPIERTVDRQPGS